MAVRHAGLGLQASRTPGRSSSGASRHRRAGTVLTDRPFCWAGPAKPAGNGTPVTGYTLTATPGGATKTITGADATTTTISGLSNGTAYTFTVVATNNVGDSQPSAASNAVTPAGIPDAVTAPTAVGGDKSATVSWAKPAGNGTPVTGYTLTATPGGATKTITGADATTTTISGLSNGTAYTFTVVATNNVGDSQPSAASNAVTPAAAPLRMRAPTVTVHGSKAIIKWAAVSHNGSRITRFRLDISKGKTRPPLPMPVKQSSRASARAATGYASPPTT